MFVTDLVTDKQYLKIDWRSVKFIKVINQTQRIYFFFFPKPFVRSVFELKVPERPVTPESVTRNKQEEMYKW